MAGIQGSISPLPILISPLYFNVNGPVVPGQPVKFNWVLWGWMKPGKLTAKIFVNNTQIYSSLNPINWTIDLPLGGGTGSESNQIQLLPGQAGAASLYQIGTVTLQLVVTCSNSAVGPYTAESTLVVNPESIDQTWWEWVSPPNSLSWNTPYSVSGNFHNKSIYSPMSCGLVLDELEPDGSILVRTSGSGTVNIGPIGISSVLLVPLANINQNWTWVDPGGIIVGDFCRGYSYTLILTMRDAYGNEYPSMSSSSIGVEVCVSIAKQVAAVTALACAAEAAADLIAEALAFASIIGAPAGPVWTGAAGLAGAASTAAYLLALDPVEPNLEFRRTHELVMPSLPPAFAEVPQNPVGVMMEIGVRVLMEIDALQQTTGRWLGARLNKDAEGVKIQRKAYRVYEKKLEDDVRALISAGQKAEEFTRTELGPYESTIAATIHLWKLQGVPPYVFKHLADLELSEEAQANVSAFLKVSTLPGPATSDTPRLKAVVLFLTMFARLAREETHKSLLNEL